MNAQSSRCNLEMAHWSMHILAACRMASGGSRPEAAGQRSGIAVISLRVHVETGLTAMRATRAASCVLDLTGAIRESFEV